MSATAEQKDEYYKYTKCESGENDLADSNKVGDSVTQDSKCVTKTNCKTI